MDRELNNRIVYCINKDDPGTLKPVTWRDVQVSQQNHLLGWVCYRIEGKRSFTS